MKLLIVSTCGTSLLTNRADDATRIWLTKIANARELTGEDEARLQVRATEQRKAFFEGEEARKRALSAEYNCISAIVEQSKPTGLVHVLLHSDTAAGEAAVEILDDYLRGQGHVVQRLTAGGLRTDDPDSFREAIGDITQGIADYGGWRDAGYSVVFNLTGGFKSINAYVQALGMFYADRCVFLFEGARSVMEIPRLPVRMTEVAEIESHLNVFRRMAMGYVVTATEASEIPSSLISQSGDRAILSIWGDVVWERVRKSLLGERLLEPLSPRLVVRSGVAAEFLHLSKEERVKANKSLDGLAAYLDGVRRHLSSETFKALSGNPTPPSTHELYASSGHGAKRFMCHYEGDIVIVDRLLDHL